MKGLEHMGYAEQRGNLGLYYNVVVLGGSERVVRAAGQAAKKNPAPPFFRRKDKGCLERAVLWGFRTRRGVQNQPEAKKISPPFLRKGKEKARRPNMVCI